MPVLTTQFVARRKVHVLASPSWLLERASAGRPILIALHDEVVEASPRELVQRLAPLVYTYMGSTLATTIGLNLTKGHFVVIVPEGVPTGLQTVRPDGLVGDLSITGSWNSGLRGFDATSLDFDDVAVLEQILHRVLLRFQSALEGKTVRRIPSDPTARALDPEQVYVVGHGNGGEMAFRLAVELAARAVERGRSYEVVVRGVAAIGASHGGLDLNYPYPQALYQPVSGQALPTVVIITGQLDDDTTYGPDSDLSESAWLGRVQDAAGLTALPAPWGTMSNWAADDWTAPGAFTVASVPYIVGTTTVTEQVRTDPVTGALSVHRIWYSDVGHPLPPVASLGIAEPMVLVWNTFAAALP